MATITYATDPKNQIKTGIIIRYTLVYNMRKPLVDLKNPNPFWFNLTLQQKLEIDTELIVNNAKRKVENKHYKKSAKYKKRALARKTGGYNAEEIYPSVN